MALKNLSYNKDYSFHHSADKNANQKNYQLHNHYGAYEIFIFLRGNADFVVEGATYPLEKYDTILLNPNEFHNIQHHSGGEYERIVLQIQNSFFTDHNCDRFRQMFDSRKPGTQNMIPAGFITENKITETISRIEGYCNDKNADILLPCAITELLNDLNKYHHPTALPANNAKITPIIMYINENLTAPLSIDSIAEKFYLNKYHLCRIFKKHTGLTINKYITHKRIVLVKNLCRSGKTLSQASAEAGFGNYSNFYKMYLKENGIPPRADIKKSDALLYHSE